ncbi:MAG: helix-turn-helix domain-containing protein, partial [Chloroflexota bacterium]
MSVSSVTQPTVAEVNGRARDAASKVAQQRLTVLQLAETLGNVSEACRRSGLDRTSFYEYKRRFQTHGLAGLKDLPPI